MNRREFLTGLVGATVVAALPTTATVFTTPFDWQQWVRDVSIVQAKVFEDMILYGTGAHEYCDEYPFIRRIDPKDLVLPTTIGGLLG